MFALLSKTYILRKSWDIRKQINRSAVDLAYVTYGPKITETNKHIIVLHGLLGSKRNWDSVCNNINKATNVCVIAADARNHGDSPHVNSHTYQELASDVSQLITKLAINKAHIIGHSMGGRTAMTLALSEPSKVSSLIIADVSPISSVSLRDSFFPVLLEAMNKVNFQNANDLPKARQVAADSIMATKIVDDINHLRFVMMNINQRPDNTFGWKYNTNALVNHFNSIATFPPELLNKQYPGPTLFVGGGQSDYIPKSDEPGIKVLFPNSELKYINHVGHNVHVEDPGAFMNMIIPFLLKVL